jgi:hypothetical protein
MFAPIHTLKKIKKYKIGVYDLDLAQGTLFQALIQWEGGV